MLMRSDRPMRTEMWEAVCCPPSLRLRRQQPAEPDRSIPPAMAARRLFRQLVAVAVGISSSDGAVYRRYSYDPWGKSRNADLSDDGACNSFPAQRCDARP